MTIAALLTLFGLLIAAYSLLTKHQRLFIRLRLSLINKILFPIFIIILVIVSEYFRDFEKEIKFFNLKFQFSFLISTFAFLFLLLASIYIFAKIKLNRLKRRKLRLFNRLVMELLNKKEYTTLVELISDEYKRLIKFSNKLSWFNNIKHNLLYFFILKPDFELTPEDIERAKEYLKESGEEDLEEKEYSKKEKAKLFFKEIFVGFKHYVGKFIRLFFHDARDKGQENSRYLLNVLLTNRDFVSKLVEIKPEIGLKIFKKEFHNYHEYVDIFFYELIKNNKSILYYEIKNNQNIDSSHHRYFINEKNKFLFFLFKDCRVAKRLEVNRGIGNYVIDYLDDLHEKDNDPYNNSYENFDEAKWNSPIFIGIKFFDIMISEILHQGMEWTHPIYYFRNFTDKILKNSRIIENIWKEPHGKSRYGYLLEEIVTLLENLVDAIKYEGFNYPIKLKNEDDNHEANVIKCCVIYLIKILDMIAQSENVSHSFKRDLGDIVLTLLFELKKFSTEESIKYSNVIFNCIKEHMFQYRRFNENFYELIRASYDKFDEIPYTLEGGRELYKEIGEYLIRIKEGKN